MAEFDKVVITKTIFMIIVLVGMLCLSLLAHQITANFEDAVFRSEYTSTVAVLKNMFQKGINEKDHAASSLVKAYEGTLSTCTFPNATLPAFEGISQGLIKLADARAVSMNPVITPETRGGFEAYALKNIHLLEGFVESRFWNVSDGIYEKNSNGVRIQSPRADPNSNHSHLFPVWQIAPISGPDNNNIAVMLNLHFESARRAALDNLMEFKTSAMTSMIQLVQDGPVGANCEPLAERSVCRPSSILFSPILGANQTVLGTVSVVFSWDTLLKGVPEKIQGLLVVIQVNKGEPFTWRIDGQNVLLLGKGDLHQRKYDSFRHTLTSTSR
jgi:hypothetical protein